MGAFINQLFHTFSVYRQRTLGLSSVLLRLFHKCRGGRLPTFVFQREYELGDLTLIIYRYTVPGPLCIAYLVLLFNRLNIH